jgi:putative hydrolase of the HAD superfamily
MTISAGKIRAIIFDIGRVLIRVDVGRAMKELGSGLRLSPTELWSAIEKDPRWQDWQEGRIPAHDWHLHLTRRLGVTLTFDQFAHAWNQVLEPTPIHESLLFETLSKKHRLALLSNTDPIHVAHMEAAYDFFRYFPKPARIYSNAHGASKPNPVLYAAALKACKAKASEAVYIDDIPAYVEAARSLGMSGIHYQSPESLKAELTALGVDLAAPRRDTSRPSA